MLEFDIYIAGLPSISKVYVIARRNIALNYICVMQSDISAFQFMRYSQLSNVLTFDASSSPSTVVTFVPHQSTNQSCPPHLQVHLHTHSVLSPSISFASLLCPIPLSARKWNTLQYLKRCLSKRYPSTSAKVEWQPCQVDYAFDLFFDCFAENEISITEVHYWGDLFMNVLKNGFPRIPRATGCCSCFDPFENEVAHNLGDFRLAIPSIKVRYLVLELCEAQGHVLPLTINIQALHTSRVLVEDSNSDKRYMTIASYGFFNGVRVFHLCANGKEIAEITDVIIPIVG